MADAGIENVFGVTGSGSSFRLIDALKKQGVNYYPVQNEAAASIMAGACAEARKLKGASICIKGPGYANALPGILLNNFENRPALHISEAYPLTKPANKVHKYLDQRAFSRISSNAYASSLDSNVVMQLCEAASNCAGPTQLDLADNSTEISKTIHPSRTLGRLTFTNLITQLKNSKNPILLLGGEYADYSNCNWPNITIPVAVTASAKGTMPENHHLYCGIATGELSSFSPENTVLKNADLIITIGLRAKDLVSPLNLNIPAIAIRECIWSNEPSLNPENLCIVDDLVVAVNAIIESAANLSWGKALVNARNTKLANWKNQTEWNLAQALELISYSVPSNTCTVVDTGFHCTVLETYWLVDSPEKFAGSTISRYMGVAIPTAIGISIGRKPLKTLCVFGNGGVGTHFSEIALAVRENLNILFVFVNDERYGSVASYTNSEIEISPARSDWTGIFDNVGCRITSADSKAKLASVLPSILENGGPAFLELQFAPQDYASFAQPIR